MGTIRRLCNQGILLKGGQVQMSGNINQVSAEYLKPVENPHAGIDIFTTDTFGILGCEVFSSENSGPYETEAISFSREIFADQKIGFRFFVRFSERMRGKIGLGGTITDSAGNRLGTIFSDYYGTKFMVRPGEVTEIRVLNEGVHLTPGRYTFSPALYCNDEKARTLVEQVHFDILPSDVFGFGHSDFQGQGPVVWNARWEQVDVRTTARTI